MKESIAALHATPHAISIDRRAADFPRVEWSLFSLMDIFLLRNDQLE